MPPDRQTLCYSATLSPAIREVASLYLKNPVRIEIGSELKPSSNVKLQSFEVPTDKKQELLEHLLGTNQGSFMVFVRTKHGADRVARRLSRAGFAAAPIHGDRSQSQRNSALRGFAEGRHRVLVATDVVARGIDVADIAHVVNYDLPREAEDFVHRVGRTGRAARLGVASTFAAPDETHALKKIERTLAINTKKYRVRPNPAAARHRHSIGAAMVPVVMDTRSKHDRAAFGSIRLDVASAHPSSVHSCRQMDQRISGGRCNQ